MVPVCHLVFPIATELECRLCLPGWILLSSVCYYFPTDGSLGYKTWAKAREFCQLYGGDLAAINSTEKEVGDGHLKENYLIATVLMDKWTASRQTFELSGVFETKSGKLSLNRIHGYFPSTAALSSKKLDIQI